MVKSWVLTWAANKTSDFSILHHVKRQCCSHKGNTFKIVNKAVWKVGQILPLLSSHSRQKRCCRTVDRRVMESTGSLLHLKRLKTFLLPATIHDYFYTSENHLGEVHIWCMWGIKCPRQHAWGALLLCTPLSPVFPLPLSKAACMCFIGLSWFAINTFYK